MRLNKIAAAVLGVILVAGILLLGKNLMVRTLGETEAKIFEISSIVLASSDGTKAYYQEENLYSAVNPMDPAGKLNDEKVDELEKLIASSKYRNEQVLIAEAAWNEELFSITLNTPGKGKQILIRKITGDAELKVKAYWTSDGVRGYELSSAEELYTALKNITK